MRFSLIVLATLLVGFAAAAPVLQSDIFKDTQKADRAQNLVHRLMVRVSTVYSQCTHNCEDEYARYKIGPYELIACKKGCQSDAI